MIEFWRHFEDSERDFYMLFFKVSQALLQFLAVCIDLPLAKRTYQFSDFSLGLYFQIYFFFFDSTTDVGQGLPVPTCGLGFQWLIDSPP